LDGRELAIHLLFLPNAKECGPGFFTIALGHQPARGLGETNLEGGRGREGGAAGGREGRKKGQESDKLDILSSHPLHPRNHIQTQGGREEGREGEVRTIKSMRRMENSPFPP